MAFKKRRHIGRKSKRSKKKNAEEHKVESIVKHEVEAKKPAGLFSWLFGNTEDQQDDDVPVAGKTSPTDNEQDAHIDF